MVKEACINISMACFGYRKNNRNVQILKNVSLQCHAGDFIGVAGLNGSGKSTFLKSLCGLLPLLEGEIQINGLSLSSVSKNLLAQNVSVVLTEKISGFNLTCFDAVAAGQLPYTDLFNRLEAAHLEVIESAIAGGGLNEHRNKLLSELSDGLFQKTMIARAVAQQTPLMLLDEPTAFLDYSSKHELFIHLKKLAEQDKKCVLVSSHDLDLILKYCNKVLLVKDSTIELIDVDQARWHTVFKELSGGHL